jgi:hypothetical protein
VQRKAQVNDFDDAAIATATETAQWDARRAGLTIGFDRIVVTATAAVASFVVGEGRRMIVGLEWTGTEWVALKSTVLGPDHRGSQSFRPSEHRPGHWTIVVGGLAPAGVATAVISLLGEERRVPVVDGLYLFAAGVDDEPELEPLEVEFVE